MLPSGQLAHPATGFVPQTNRGQQFLRRQAARVETPHKREDFVEGQVLVVGGCLQLDAYAGFDLAAPEGHVQAKYTDAAGVGAQQPLNDLQRGGLACPVGSKQPKNLSALNGQRKMINGNYVAVPLDQIVDHQGMGHFRLHQLRSVADLLAHSQSVKQASTIVTSLQGWIVNDVWIHGLEKSTAERALRLAHQSSNRACDGLYYLLPPKCRSETCRPANEN